MDLLNASLLALDAYNRDTAPEMSVPFGAEIIRSEVVGQFAAVAYYMPDTDEVVIAFRGTDDPLWDGMTGWPIGGGYYDWLLSQADLAFTFYNDAVADVADPLHTAHSANWSLAGHSLGGGLAGLVASTKGLPAFVFDSMPFVDAANKLYDDVSGPNANDYAYWKALAFPDGLVHEPSFAQIESAAIQGEILSALRWGTPFQTLGGLVVTSGSDAQTIEQNQIRAGSVSDSGNLHSQALLTIALHGGLSHSSERKAGGDAIYKFLFDASLATELGFADPEALRQNLAYTVDDSVVALDSLYSDMDVLGAMSPSSNPHIDALAKLSIMHAVHIGAQGGGTLRLGLIEQGNGIANIALSGVIDSISLISDFIEFSASVLDGVFFDAPTNGMSNLAVSWSGYGGDAHLESGGTVYFGSMYLDNIYGSQGDDVIISLGSDKVFYDTVRGGGGSDLIYASAGADTLKGDEGNDRIYGGAGNDILHGGTGSDAMFGEADNDTFHLGDAEVGDVDYINGGSGSDTLQVSVGAKYRLDAAGAAAILSTVVAEGFPAPTGPGIGVDTALGDAFVQTVETIKASGDANELYIGTTATITSAGATTYDFTAGLNDQAFYGALERAVLSLVGDAGRSKGQQVGAITTSFFGVDEWNLTSMADEVYVDKSHLGAQTVTINAGGGYDILHLSSFTGPIVYGLVPLIGGTNVIATGFERIHTGSGDDEFYGSSADEYWHAGGGTNTLIGSLGADTAVSTGNLIVDYSASTASVHLYRSSGTANTAAVSGSTISSIQSMGHGDSLSATGWSEIIGSSHEDTLAVAGAYGTLRSGGGNDTLTGWKNADTLIGADGYAEIINPGDGSDTIQFGTGGGELNFDSSTRAAVIDMIDGTFVFGDQFDTVTGDFERLVGTKYGDSIKGTEGADIIDGGSGSGYDVIYGRAGGDTITFRNGVVHGGDGNDVISSTESSTIVFGEDDDDTISIGKNSLAYGGEGADIITAGEGSTIYGEAGDDVLTTYAKNVTISGGTGADTITFITGGYPQSTLSYAESDAGVSLILANGAIIAAGGHAQGDQLFGSFKLIGSSFADIFDLGGSETGSLKAGSGDDVISARRGTIEGEAGNDTITLFDRFQYGYGGTDNDTFHGHGIMYGDGGDDEFYLGYGEYYPGAGSHATVKIGGTVRGGAGQNHIEGGAGNDTIWMDEGSDTFVFSGLGGDDTIIGAGADDTFVLDGISSVQSLFDVQANLYELADRTELRFDSSIGKIAFTGMTAGQVLALDWSFV